MAARCTVCSSEYRATIDAQLLEGVPVAVVARNPVFGTKSTGLSADALYRHARTHLVPSLTTPVGDTALTDLSLYGHMEAGLHDVTRVGERASATGNTTLLLKSAQVRVQIAKDLLDRMPDGEGLDLLDALHDAEGFIRALMRLTKKDPQLGLAIADQLEADDAAAELRDSFRIYATGAIAALESTKENNR